MLGPASWYSSFVIHMHENVEIEDKIEPPIQTQYFLSGTAMTLTFDEIFCGASFWTSFVSLSGNPANNVVPPDKTMFWYKSFLTSTSDFWID